MATVTVRELSQDTSSAIQRVELGEEVHVTKRGRLVAIIVPASDELRRRAALVTAGLAETPGLPGGLTDLEPWPAPADAPALSDLLHELREGAAQARVDERG